MPLYEYKCTKCGSVFEVLQKITDPPLDRCIHCRGPVHKLISPPTIQFKGNGWYVTDYAAKGKHSGDKGKEPTPKTSGQSVEKKDSASGGKKDD